MPVVGYLGTTQLEYNTAVVPFLNGLGETGFVEGKNVAIEYRWAEGHYDRLPELATDLVRRKVAVIVAAASYAALAAKAATETIPIVFLAPENPVSLGLVTSLARPGGNLTGINFLTSELTAKRLDLLRGLVPTATQVALLVEPNNVLITESVVRDVQAAARTMGLQIRVLNANTSGEIDTAFATLGRERSDALFVSTSAFFNARRVQLAQWATYFRIPATYTNRDFVEAGGLMSYGANRLDSFRQIGVYTGRILKGAKPAELPVLQSTKIELVINHQTARMLGITVPPSLLAIADEVIE